MVFQTIKQIYAGDTSDIWEAGFIVAEPATLAVLDENYTCWIGVRERTDFIPREVTDKTDDNTRFRAWLTPEETRALGPGVWTVGIEIRNPTTLPPLVKEDQRRIRIRPEAVRV